jgi:hypothetical protein
MKRISLLLALLLSVSHLVLSQEFSSRLEMLKQAEEYNYDDPTHIFEFAYQSSDNVNLKRIRRSFNLDSIAGQGNEVSKFINLMHWVHNVVPHDGNSSNPEPRTTDNIIKVCKKENRGVNCRMLATILNECYLAMGFESRFVTCMPKESQFDDCHVINMVYSNDLKKWLWMDPTNDAYVMNEKGELLSIEEVRARLIQGKPLILNPDANWNRKQSTTKAYYLEQYMAKNLYRFETPLVSEYSCESPENGKNEMIYVELLPLDGIELRIISNRKYITNNPHIFWETSRNYKRLYVEGNNKRSHKVSNETPQQTNSVYTVKNGVLTIYWGRESVIEIPDNIGVRVIGRAFAHNSTITSVKIPEGVDEICERAFENCTNLNQITFPNTLKSIARDAFWKCSSLTSVTIPKSVTSIERNAFIYCSKLTSINVNSSNPAYMSEDGVLYDKKMTTLLQYPGGKKGHFTTPEAVTIIGWDAFYGCVGLTSITFSNSVKNLVQGTFWDCSNLKSVTVPASVKRLGPYIFQHCSNLKNVEVRWQTPVAVSDIFQGVDLGSVTLTVPADTKAVYRNAPVWKKFGTIKEK